MCFTKITSAGVWPNRRHTIIPGAPHLNTNDLDVDVKRELNGQLISKGSSSGSLKAIPFVSSEKLSIDKKEWPELERIVKHGRKTSAERVIDFKIQQNKSLDRPVILNVGGTKYQVKHTKRLKR